MRKNKSNLNRIITIGVMAVAVAFIVIGVSQSQPSLIMEKAIRVCLECIGIG